MSLAEYPNVTGRHGDQTAFCDPALQETRS